MPSAPNNTPWIPAAEELATGDEIRDVE